MAKIPRYVQDSIASQVVGTPGIDNSALSAANTITGATNALADSKLANNAVIAQGVLGLASDIGQVLKQRRHAAQAQAKAAAHQLQERANQVALARNSLQISNKLNGIQTMAQTSSLSYPMAAGQKFEDDTKDLISKHLSENKIPLDSELAQMIEKDALQQIEERSKTLNKWSNTQLKQNAAQDAEYVKKEFPKVAEGFGSDIDGLEKYMAKNAPMHKNRLAQGLGEAKAINEMEDAVRNTAKQSLAYNSVNNPEKMAKLVKDPRFVQWGVTNEQLNVFDRAAKTELSKRAAKAKEEQKDARNKYHKEIDENVFAAEVNGSRVSNREATIAAIQYMEGQAAKFHSLKPEFQDPETLDYITMKLKRLKNQDHSIDVEDRQEKKRDQAAKEHTAVLGRLAASQNKANTRDAWIEEVSSGKGLEARVDFETKYKYAVAGGLDAKISKEEKIKRINEANKALDHLYDNKWTDPPNHIKEYYAQHKSALNATKDAANFGSVAGVGEMKKADPLGDLWRQWTGTQERKAPPVVHEVMQTKENPAKALKVDMDWDTSFNAEMSKQMSIYKTRLKAQAVKDGKPEPDLTDLQPNESQKEAVKNALIKRGIHR